MPILTGARYAVRVLADHGGYVTSTEIMDTPEAINTDNYQRYGVYGLDGSLAVKKTAGDIEMEMEIRAEINSSRAFFTVMLHRGDIASVGAVFVMFAPPQTIVSGLEFDDSRMSDGYLLLEGDYEADTEPTFFLGIGGIAPPPPPTSFWTSFVGSREIT